MVSQAKSRRLTGARLRFASLPVLAILSCAPVPLIAEPVTLSSADRMLLAEYRVIGREQAPMLIATEPKRTRAVTAKLTALGAQVLSRKDEIGYVYAFVPIDAVASVLQLEGLEALQVAVKPVRGRMDVDASAAFADAGSKPRSKGAAPTAALTPDNPYTGEAATQALDFKSRNPTFDGRGVVTAFVEPVAPTLETMRGALDASGRPLPKFAYYDIPLSVAPEEPVAGGGDRVVIWQQTERVEPDADGAFTWRGRNYQLPKSISRDEIASIRWRMCRRLPNFILEEYDVLWAENRQQVWVTPASARGDFSTASSASLRESPATIALNLPVSSPGGLGLHALVVDVDPRRRWLALVPTTAGHAGMVGSVMAGAGFLGSKANGVAPATQLAIYLAPHPLGAQTLDGHEQILTMLADPIVDVAQASLALGDTSRSGASIQSIWADRLIGANGRPFVKAAGNYGPQLFGIAEFTMAESVFAVGGYAPRATWRANLGVDSPTEHLLASYSAWGPSRDGGLKPDFLALTHTLAEGGGFGPWYWDGDTKGYGVSGGTSASGPHGAGHVALLVSAAKQSGVAHDAPRLRAAIATTAKFLDGIQARAQGHGLIQVSDAWEALKRAHAWTPPSFEVRAPLVGQEAGPNGAPQSTGRGLLELSGWKPGRTGRRELIITRKGGKRDASSFALRWKGHTEAFRSELREIELPLGKAVSIPVDIRVGDSGSYSAILDLIDSRTQLVAGSILHTVIVSDRLEPNGDGLRYDVESPRPGTSLFFVDVPAGLSAITVSLAKDTGTTSAWLATDPTGRMLPFNGYGSEMYRRDERDAALPKQHFAYQDPVPGVWQFELRNVEPRSMAQLESVKDWSKPLPLDVHIQGWRGPDREPAITRASEPLAVSLRESTVPVDAKVEALALGAARELQTELHAGLEPRFFELTVAPGTTSLDVQIEQADPSAHVGLYVFKVPEGARVDSTLTSDHTALVYRDTSFEARKRYRLEAPPPGKYKVAIDPLRVGGASLAVTYRDVIRHPLFGSVSVAEDERSASIELRAKPADGRKLHAEIELLKLVGPTARAVLGRQEWFVEP